MEPVSYDQILREVAAKRGLKPWEVAFSGPAESPQATGAAQMQAVDPMALAAKRAELMQALGQMGNMANPETQMANQGQKPNPGLLQLLMSLMGK
jgi:hypothetical protein